MSSTCRNVFLYFFFVIFVYPLLFDTVTYTYSKFSPDYSIPLNLLTVILFVFLCKIVILLKFLVNKRGFFPSLEQFYF